MVFIQTRGHRQTWCTTSSVVSFSNLYPSCWHVGLSVSNWLLLPRNDFKILFFIHLYIVVRLCFGFLLNRHQFVVDQHFSSFCCRNWSQRAWAPRHAAHTHEPSRPIYRRCSSSFSICPNSAILQIRRGTRNRSGEFIVSGVRILNRWLWVDLNLSWVLRFQRTEFVLSETWGDVEFQKRCLGTNGVVCWVWIINISPSTFLCLFQAAEIECQKEGKPHSSCPKPCFKTNQFYRSCSNMEQRKLEIIQISNSLVFYAHVCGSLLRYGV